MPTMSEHFVEESEHLSSYRGNADDNGGVEPEYPPALEVEQLFAWLRGNLDSARSVLPEHRPNHYARGGATTVLTFADGTHATVHSAWYEDCVDVYEGTEDRDFHAQPGKPIIGIARLNPAGDRIVPTCGIAPARVPDRRRNAGGRAAAALGGRQAF